jgi:hypothetical protein
MGEWNLNFTCLDASRTVDGEPTVTSWTPAAKRQYRLVRTGKTFLQWLEAELDWIDWSPDPPRDWTNAAAWDRYWGRVVAEERHAVWHIGGGIVHPGLDFLRELGLSRVLCAGNGISLGPWSMCHSGFEVTVLDVAPTATEFVRSARVDEEFLARCFQEYGLDGQLNLDRSRERVALEYRPGGSLTAITADLFTYEPSQPFHLVSSQRALQGFDEEWMRELLRRFSSWLAPGGICSILTLNLWAEHQRYFQQLCASAGFFVHLRETQCWLEAQMECSDASSPQAVWQEYAERAAEETQADAERLRRGEKMVMLLHSSG